MKCSLYNSSWEDLSLQVTMPLPVFPEQLKGIHEKDVEHDFMPTNVQKWMLFKLFIDYVVLYI